MSGFDDYRRAYGKLAAAGVTTKGGSATETGWAIDAVYADRDGVGEMMSLTSIDEVDAFIGSWCPACDELDRRRTKGGRCAGCRRLP